MALVPIDIYLIGPGGKEIRPQPKIKKSKHPPDTLKNQRLVLMSRRLNRGAVSK